MLAGVLACLDTKPPAQVLLQPHLQPRIKVGEHLFQRFRAAERHQAVGKTADCPQAGFRLPAIGIAAAIVEIGSGEGRVEAWQEAPGAVIETLAGHIEIVGIQNPMDKSRRHPRPCRGCNARRHRRKKGRGKIVHRRIGIELCGKMMTRRMPHQHLDALDVLQIAASLETADADMAVRQPHHDRGPGRRRLVMTLQRLPGLDHRKGLRGIDAKRLEQLGRHDFAHRALQSQAPVGCPRERCLARPLGPEVQNAPIIGAQLGKQETAPVAELVVVMAELMAVITQRKRALDIAGKRRKPAEMIHPGGIVQSIETDRRGRTVIAPAKDVLRERGGLDTPVEAVV